MGCTASKEGGFGYNSPDSSGSPLPSEDVDDGTNAQAEFCSGKPSLQGVEEWIDFQSKNSVYHFRISPKRSFGGRCMTTDTKQLYALPPLNAKISSLSLTFLTEFKGLGPITSASLSLSLTQDGQVFEYDLGALASPVMMFKFDLRTQSIIRSADRGGVYRLMLQTTSEHYVSYAITLSGFVADLRTSSPCPAIYTPFEESIIKQNVFVLSSNRAWRWSVYPANPTALWVSSPPMSQLCAKVVVMLQYKMLAKGPVHFTSVRLELCLLRGSKVMAACPLLSLHPGNYKNLENQLLTVLVDQSAHDDQAKQVLGWMVPGDCLVIRRTLIAAPASTTIFVLTRFFLQLYAQHATTPCCQPSRNAQGQPIWPESPMKRRMSIDFNVDGQVEDPSAAGPPPARGLPNKLESFNSSHHSVHRSKAPRSPKSKRRSASDDEQTDDKCKGPIAVEAIDETDVEDSGHHDDVDYEEEEMDTPGRTCRFASNDVDIGDGVDLAGVDVGVDFGDGFGDFRDSGTPSPVPV